MSNLTLLKWTDSDKKKHKISVIDAISVKWPKVSDLLGFPPDETKRIEMNYSAVEDRGREVISRWLQCKAETYEYPTTWGGLIELLEDLDMSTLAEEIQSVVF